MAYPRVSPRTCVTSRNGGVLVTAAVVIGAAVVFSRRPATGKCVPHLVNFLLAQHRRGTLLKNAIVYAKKRARRAEEEIGKRERNEEGKKKGKKRKKSVRE